MHRADIRRAFLIAFALLCLTPAAAQARLSVPWAGPLPDPIPVQLSTADCLGCHGIMGIQVDLPSGEVFRLFIDPGRYASSLHGDLDCVECHPTITEFPHPPLEADTLREYTLNHYRACGECHPEALEETEEGSHQLALAGGNMDAAVCTDCHTAHYVQPPDDPVSRSARMCQSCHLDAFDLYRHSIHGEPLLQDENPDVPSCSGCHEGAHAVLGPTFFPYYPVDMYDTCGSCHDDPAIADKYGMNSQVYFTYVHDVHGSTAILIKRGAPRPPVDTPVCIDCHGVHDILPPSDPASLMSNQNRLATCRRCHPQATVNFANAYLGHQVPGPKRTPFVFGIGIFYLIVIPTVLGSMLIFNLADLRRRVADRLRKSKEKHDDRKRKP
jgi:hypothetical protein